MEQEPLQPFDPLPRGPNMAALTAISTTLDRKTIIGWKQNDAGAEQIKFFTILEDGPAQWSYGRYPTQFQTVSELVGSYKQTSFKGSARSDT